MIAVFQHDPRGADPASQQLGHVDDVLFAGAVERYRPQIAHGRCPARTAQRLGQGHRDIDDGQYARTLDLSIHIEALAAVGIHARTQFRLLEVFCILLHQQIVQFPLGQPCNLDRADIGKMDLAFVIDCITGTDQAVGLTVRDGGHDNGDAGRHLSLAEQDNRDDIADAYRVGLGLGKQLAHDLVDLLVPRGPFFLQQLRSDFLHDRLYALRVTAVRTHSRHHGAGGQKRERQNGQIPFQREEARLLNRFADHN